MAISSAENVKNLRERTGAGMMDCKAALEASGGDIEKAVDFLRKKGVAQAAKRAGREAREGVVALRINGTKAALVEANCETDFVARTEDFRSLAEMALNEVLSKGESAITGDMITHRISELSGKIGEKLIVRRARRVDASGGVLYGYLHSNQKLAVIVELSVSSDELGKNLAMQVAASNPLCIRRAEVPAATLEREKAIYREEIKGKPETIVEKILQGKLEKFYQTHCLLEQPFIKDDKISVGQLLGPVQVKQFVRFQLGESPGQ